MKTKNFFLLIFLVCSFNVLTANICDTKFEFYNSADFPNQKRKTNFTPIFEYNTYLKYKREKVFNQSVIFSNLKLNFQSSILEKPFIYDDVHANSVLIHGNAPTLYFLDETTGERSGMIHVNSNLMYFLRGSGTASTTWEAVNNAWPLMINLENNQSTFGGYISVNGGGAFNGDLSVSNGLTLGTPGGPVGYIDISNGTSGRSRIRAMHTDNNNVGIVMQYLKNGTLYDGLTMNTYGNIGIGTTNITNNKVVAAIDGTESAGFAYLARAVSNAGFVGILTNAGSGQYNNLVKNNDHAIIYSGPSGIGNGGLVIAPWHSNNNAGIRMDGIGNVGIGTSNTSSPDFKLYVETGIRTRKVKVDQSTWPDYVFKNEYKLLPLNELEKYIIQNKHLPEVPSENVVKKEGVDLGDNQALLLKKIEELTLYIIEQNKLILQENKKSAELSEKLKALESKLEKLMYDKK